VSPRHSINHHTNLLIISISIPRLDGQAKDSCKRFSNPDERVKEMGKTPIGRFVNAAENLTLGNDRKFHQRHPVAWRFTLIFLIVAIIVGSTWYSENHKAHAATTSPPATAAPATSGWQPIKSGYIHGVSTHCSLQWYWTLPYQQCDTVFQPGSTAEYAQVLNHYSGLGTHVIIGVVAGALCAPAGLLAGVCVAFALLQLQRTLDAFNVGKAERRCADLRFHQVYGGPMFHLTPMVIGDVYPYTHRGGINSYCRNIPNSGGGGGGGGGGGSW
jgi:hypothetical protein